jgi:16S rRNA (uracil1498-N3)-methyltransferase
MQLFYYPDLDKSSESFTFDKEESRHILKVLRKKADDEILITNGKGYFFEGIIQEIMPKKCTVQIKACHEKYARRYYLHMVVAPTKMNDRYEWFLEKATEIGVDEITPVFCVHSERKTIKKERFEKIVIAAMKQSLSAYLPKLNDPIHFEDFLSKDLSGQLFIAHCEEGYKYALKRRVQPDTPITILIGPEGDFSSEEIEKATEKKFLPITLSNNRLRTETAAVVACAEVAFCNQ